MNRMLKPAQLIDSTKVHLRQIVRRSVSTERHTTDDPQPIGNGPNAKTAPANHSSTHTALPKSLSFTNRTTRCIQTLSNALRCTPRASQELLVAHPELVEHTARIEPICQHLFEHKVKPYSIVENPFLFTTPLKTIVAKLPLIQAQRPRDINDFVPLLRGSINRLHKMRKQTALEADLLPGGHRVYYLSARLQLEARIVAQHMSTHFFMFDLPAEQLIENLDVQLKYNVAPINILRDPWAFRYSNKAIQMRLDRATEGHKDKLMPWMVRCPEIILAKSIQHSVDEKLLLGDRTLVEYIAERLGFDVITTKFILDKHPQIYTTRATKIKEILDYFLVDNSEYNANDLAQVPRILCHSLETTKFRLNELRDLGCKPNSLVVVCRSSNEYRKFVDAWTNGTQRKRAHKH